MLNVVVLIEVCRVFRDYLYWLLGSSAQIGEVK